jgi:DNA mismatch repair protein MutS
VRPKILYSGEIRIQEGRHPVVEQLLNIQQFVPNDVTLDTVSQQQLLITGPNMAGKSVFIRQVAVIVLMAQMGCYVPAKSAHISIVDRIFVRSGASDVITSGLSTFMVEMVETAHILHHATKDSLIIMDEIGRGTSTYDGISIAWAVAEYLVTKYKIPPKTLFASHYHELQALEELNPNKIKNFHMAVADDKGSPIFLHTLMPGGASHSFGVAVAKLAGVPDAVIGKANEILKNLEGRNVDQHSAQPVILSHTNDRSEENKIIHFVPNDSTSIIDKIIHKELEHIDISRMTPLEALNKLAEMKEKLSLLSIQPEIQSD